MTENPILSLLSKYQNDIVMLDALLQWAMNPTSKSASYGIDVNYEYISKNLKEVHELRPSKIDQVMEKLRKENDNVLEKAPEKIYEYRKIIITVLSKKPYILTFSDFFKERIKNFDGDVERFLLLYKNAPYKNLPYISVQYDAVFGEKIDLNKLLLRFGILKNLYWIKVKLSNSCEKAELIPILDHLIEQFPTTFVKKIKNKLGFKKWPPKLPNIDEYFDSLVNNRKMITLNFLENIYKENNVYSLYFKYFGGALSQLTRQKGLFGTYISPSGEEYAGISFLIKDSLFSKIKEYLEKELQKKTKVIIKILEYEKEQGNLPSNRDLVAKFDINIDEIDNILQLLNEIPLETLIEDEFINKIATDVIKVKENPTLYDLLTTFELDIETAQKVGKYLIDQKIINVLNRIAPLKEKSPYQLKISEQRRIKRVLTCSECNTVFDSTKVGQEEYCPYCVYKFR